MSSTREQPDQYRKRVGRCPPGFRYSGTRCLPNDQVKRTSVSTQPRTSKQEVLTSLPESHFTRPPPPDKVRELEKFSNEMADVYAPGLKSLHPLQHKALQDYTGTTYRGVNQYLRSGQADPEDQHHLAAIPHLDSAFEKLRIKEPIIAYRGAVYPEFFDAPSGSLVGHQFKDPGYMSTSLDLNTAYGFMRMKHKAQKKAVLMEVRLPKGARATYMEGITENPGELELLVDRNSDFRVVGETSVNWNGKDWQVLQVEYVVPKGKDKRANKKN